MSINFIVFVLSSIFQIYKKIKIFAVDINKKLIMKGINIMI